MRHIFNNSTYIFTLFENAECVSGKELVSIMNNKRSYENMQKHMNIFNLQKTYEKPLK